jgi:hypothetical protein
MKDLIVDISWSRGSWRYSLTWNRSNRSGLRINRYNVEVNKSERIWPRK